MKLLLMACSLVLGAPLADAAPERYVMAPVRRHIGFDPDRPDPTTIVVEGVEAALREAVGAGIGHAVYEFSGGRGSADEAILVADAILARNDEIETVALIRECRGPALFIAMACEQWFVVPGSRRPVLTLELSGNEADRAEELVRLAKATGRSEALARALAIPGATLYARDGLGENPTLSGESPGEALDDSTTARLTLTGDQLIELGLAREATRVVQLWAPLGLDAPWKRVGRPNHAMGPETVRAMIDAERDRARRLREILDALASIEGQAGDAAARCDHAARQGARLPLVYDPSPAPGEDPEAWRRKMIELAVRVKRERDRWADARRSVDAALAQVDQAPEAMRLFSELEYARPFQARRASEGQEVETRVRRALALRAALTPWRERASAQIEHLDNLLRAIRVTAPVP
ncbi:MAG: hypothetical protein ACIARR_05290 [Phycisphaerales bacterium JB059]